VGVATRRVHRPWIALLSLVLVGHPVAAAPGHWAAFETAGSVGIAVAIAVIAVLLWIQDRVSTFLRRCAVVIARIDVEGSGVVHIAINDVAVVADLARVDDAVAAGAVQREIEATSPPKELQ
jgi:hypothetical protein